MTNTSRNGSPGVCSKVVVVVVAVLLVFAPPPPSRSLLLLLHPPVNKYTCDSTLFQPSLVTKVRRSRSKRNSPGLIDKRTRFKEDCNEAKSKRDDEQFDDNDEEEDDDEEDEERAMRSRLVKRNSA